MNCLCLRVFLSLLLTVTLTRESRAANSPKSEKSPSSTILIQNATLLTVTHGIIEHGSILIQSGKIAQIGASIQAPKDALVIDAKGQYVMPGIIDCHSHIAIEGHVNESSISVSSIANIADVLNSDDIDIYRDLAGGVTTANVLHGSANSIGGQTVVIKLRWGQPSAKLPFEGALPGIKFALGENPKDTNRDEGPARRYPATRMGVEETIRGAFAEARYYQGEWETYNKRVAAGSKNLIPPRRDLRLEPLVEVLEGKRYVHAHCYREDEILMLLRVAKEFGFKVRTFQHVLEGYKVADELAAAGAGASTFSDWWAYKIEAYDAIPYNAALMTRRGVLVSINSDDAEEATHLNQEAAKSIKSILTGSWISRIAPPSKKKKRPCWKRKRKKRRPRRPILLQRSRPTPSRKTIRTRSVSLMTTCRFPRTNSWPPKVHDENWADRPRPRHLRAAPRCAKPVAGANTSGICLRDHWSKDLHPGRRSDR
jgi:imidazolonepropionase-like amidohydrolase